MCDASGVKEQFNIASLLRGHLPVDIPTALISSFASNVQTVMFCFENKSCIILY